MRKCFLDDYSEIEITDFGVGSKKFIAHKSIHSIAKKSLKSAGQAALLFRAANFIKAEVMLELGTSLGITTLYLAQNRFKKKMITIEGDPLIQKRARANFEKMDGLNITSLVGNFDEVLPKILSENEKIDFAFIDGNHREAPTLKYFNLIRKKSHENSVIILDDIHWSEEMESAWNKICQMPEVSLSIDTFHLGFAFFHKGRSKQHFSIRS